MSGFAGALNFMLDFCLAGSGKARSVFTTLFILQPILIFSLAWVDRGNWNVNSLFGYSAATICFIAAAYTMHSVRVHFSFSRAFGIDHFEESYRKMPFVRKGAFRISPNAMYVFGFLTLWIPAFLCQSKAALVMACLLYTSDAADD